MQKEITEHTCPKCGKLVKSDEAMVSIDLGNIERSEQDVKNSFPVFVVMEYGEACCISCGINMLTNLNNDIASKFNTNTPRVCDAATGVKCCNK
jgi:hypothetical protein